MAGKIGKLFGKHAPKKEEPRSVRQMSEAEKQGLFRWETGKRNGMHMVTDMGNVFYESDFDGKSVWVDYPDGIEGDSVPRTCVASAEKDYLERVRPEEKLFMDYLSKGVYYPAFATDELQERGRQCKWTIVGPDRILPTEEFLRVADGKKAGDRVVSDQLYGRLIDSIQVAGTYVTDLDSKLQPVNISRWKFGWLRDVVPEEPAKMVPTNRGHEFDGLTAGPGEEGAGYSM